MAKNNSNKQIAKTLILEWRETRSLTLDWINFHSKKVLQQKLPRTGLDTYAKHLIEMAEVQNSYVDVLFGKNLKFSNVGRSASSTDFITKNQLIKLLKVEDQRFYKIVNNIKNWDKPVKLFGKKYPLYYVIELLIRHETLHHGQFIAFCYNMNLNFPKSWKITWALP